MKAHFTNAGARAEFTSFTNATATDDGWMHVAPIGDFEGVAREFDSATGKEKKTRAIQRIDKAAIAQMCNSANKRRGISKFLTAPPLFLGHPNKDPDLYADKKPKGVFVNFKETDQGLFGEPVLTDEGETLVASRAYPGISGHWDSEDTGEKTAEGLRIFRPLNFLSAGLVKHPNLPTFLNDTLAAQCEQPDPTVMKKEKVIPLLKSSGIEITNEATDDQLEAAITQLATTAAKVGPLETQFTNERTARINDAISRALETGRITAAEKPDWERRLKGADFTNEIEALGKLAPKVKTESVIDPARGNGKGAAAMTRAQRTQFLNSAMTEVAAKHKLDLRKNYDQVYRLTQSERPDIFEAMQESPVNRPTKN